jgi:hypothetical protein
MYNLQTTTGTYESSKCLSVDNLINNLILKPEIFPTLMFQAQGFTMNYVTQALGRYANDRIEYFAQREVSWFLRPRGHRPITFSSWVSGTGASTSFGGVITVIAQNNYASPNDVIRLSNGQMLFVDGKPVKTTGGYQYRLRLNAGAGTTTVPTAQFAGGKQGGILGNKFPAGSPEGYGNVVGEQKYTNWFTISRKGIKADNEGIMGVTWITNPQNGKTYWYYDWQYQIIQDLMWEMEHMKWDGQKSTLDGGATWLTPDNGKKIVSGSGFIEQVEGANSDTYIPNVTPLFVEKLKDRIDALYIKGSAVTYDTIGIHTGKVGGSRVFDAAMRADFREGYKTLFYSPKAGTNLEVGEGFKTYFYNDKKLVLMGNMVFEDDNVYTDASINGRPARSFDMFFIPMEGSNEKPNVCAATRKMKDGSNDREFVSVKLAGMITPDGSRPEYVSTSEDSYREEYLAEHMLVVFDPQKTAQLRALAA